MERRLAALGIATVGQLRDVPRAELERRFGRWGVRLHELSLGIDNHPVVTGRPTLQVSCEDTFEADLLLDELEAHLRRLADKAWDGTVRERARTGRIARTVVLKLKTSDVRLLTRSHTPERPPADATTVGDIACDLRTRVALPSRTRFRLAGVGLAGFVAADDVAVQAALFTAERESPETDAQP